MFRCEKDGSGYYFIAGEEILYHIKELAMVFSKDEEGMWTLHKIGEKETVQKWYDTVVAMYRVAGLADIANDMVMITGAFPVEELNRCLDTSGYIRIMCEKLGLDV